MKRRKFLSRLAKASLAFVAAPGCFKALPSVRNVRAAVVGPSVAQQKAFVLAFFFSEPTHGWISVEVRAEIDGWFNSNPPEFRTVPIPDEIIETSFGQIPVFKYDLMNSQLRA